jgi:hypothetical protein
MGKTTSQRIAAWSGEAVEGRYVIAYEPAVDAPLSVVIPDPNWLAMAMAGGVLPAAEVYQTRDLATIDAAPPIGPLSEEQAMEYLVQKDVPRGVWDRPGENRRSFAITLKSMLPASRQWRNAWRLTEV